MDQRALFFIVAAVLAALILPVTDESLQYVPKIVSVTYVVLAAASYLDWRTSRR
jgi:flagellar biosynthesis protein FliQ